MGAYTPPQPKHRKKVERARYRQLPARKEKQTASSAAPPAGVPTLDQVNAQKGAPVQVASTSKGTEKPGKKEKIRFGQAPRETLPSGDTKQVDVDAGATAGPGQQVAANTPPANAVALTNAEGNVISDSTDTEKKTKARFSDRMKEPKQKQEQQKAARKKQKFVPPTETPEQVAQDKQDQAALGLAGDTTKKKKPAPVKGGPKRRMGDEEKSAPQNGSAGASTSNGTGTPASQTPATPQSAPPPNQSTPPAQGTTPTQPQL
jgi:peptidyl-prolyl cis-trans isomerase SurA